MRVPEHDGCEAGRNRIKIELRYVMEHPKYHLPNLDSVRRREVCCPRLAINVATDGECRSKGAQLVDHLQFPDIASMDDERRSAHRIDGLGA